MFGYWRWLKHSIRTKEFVIVNFSLLNMIYLMRLSINLFFSATTTIVEFLASSRFSWQWWRNQKREKKRSQNENARESDTFIYLNLFVSIILIKYFYILDEKYFHVITIMMNYTRNENEVKCWKLWLERRAQKDNNGECEREKKIENRAGVWIVVTTNGKSFSMSLNGHFCMYAK